MAEAVGCTADELEHRITEREFVEWQVRGKPPWPRRLEILLAQLALVVARSGGNKKAEFGDFDIFAPPPAVQTPALTGEEGAQVLGVMAGGIGHRKLGQGRKKRST